MAIRNAPEHVSVSFHRLVKETRDDKNNITVLPFGIEEFSSIARTIMSIKKPDFADQSTIDAIRLSGQASIFFSDLVDTRTLFGQFYSPYTGHAYDNTAKGQIPADSISLRPFFFILYLSKAGNILIGCQYLGQFGGYTAFQHAMRKIVKCNETLSFRTFRDDSFLAANLSPTEVRVSVVKSASRIDQDNVFSTQKMITFKRGPNDTEFSSKVKRSLFPLLGKPRDEVLTSITQQMRASGFIEIDDSDIVDCSIVADVNGRSKVFYLLNDGSFATKYPISVGLNKDGHPERQQTRKAMIQLLEEKIIPKL